MNMLINFPDKGHEGVEGHASARGPKLAITMYWA
jgi:hypothetical protein